MQRRFVLPGPDVGRLLLDRLVAEGVRYGRDFAVVRIMAPLGTVETLAPQLSAVLRDADVLVRWEADELLALLPATDRAGAERAAERLREASTEVPISVGAAHWVGDTAHDLIGRALPRR
ncbi:diguanylate cyclase domain-containing protein [Candidatus Solirubrobacter pratensis]|uniref:diguanylate cyclase domain-containing protein n=1 Tax=Candidatus Solirubrobacter pratensis TaxID=1298857 RepID=UPI001E5764AD|nr:diguanylate cyclase [Candidatus Solirubrobacter pratensis]